MRKPTHLRYTTINYIKPKLMRFSKICYLLLISATVFISCKKDKADKPSLIGMWKGKYGGGTAYPNVPWTILFRDNGTLRVFDGSDTTTALKAEGTYTVAGTTVTTFYKYASSQVYSTSATINPNMTFQEGTYGSGGDVTNGGRFFLVKE